MLRVLVDALVGIDPDLAGEAQHVGPLGREPLVEQLVRQPFAQPDLGHLLQPGLGHDQHEQAAGDERKDDELGQERRHLLLLDRVVEGALPDVQPDLPEDGEADDHDHGRDQEVDAAAVGRPAHRADEGRKMPGQVAFPLWLSGRSGPVTLRALGTKGATDRRRGRHGSFAHEH
jgi:hypothetical protein